MWIPKGVRPVIPTLGNHFKLDCYGFVNPLSGETFEAVTQGQNSRIFCSVTEEFLQHKGNEGKLIILVLDHAPWHTSKKTAEFLESRRNQIIHLLWVPGYSGDLNVREYIWKELRKEVSHNFFYKDEEAMEKALKVFFTRLKNNPNRVKRITTIRRLTP